jgi:hypothetical protein
MFARGRSSRRRAIAAMVGALWLLAVEVLPGLHLAFHDGDHTHLRDGSIVSWHVHDSGHPHGHPPGHPDDRGPGGDPSRTAVVPGARPAPADPHLGRGSGDTGHRHHHADPAHDHDAVSHDHRDDRIAALSDLRLHPAPASAILEPGPLSAVADPALAEIEAPGLTRPAPAAPFLARPGPAPGLVAAPPAATAEPEPDADPAAPSPPSSLTGASPHHAPDGAAHHAAALHRPAPPPYEPLPVDRAWRQLLQDRSERRAHAPPARPAARGPPHAA